MLFDEKKIKELLKKRLTPKRYQHSLMVAERALQMAAHWGADKEKTLFAALVHDICKDIPHNEQLKLIKQGKVETDAILLCSPQLWHAVAGFCYVRDELYIHDHDILNAIRYHTTGRSGMSLLEKIIYLADLTSAERDYPDVDYTRALVDEDLSKGMLYSLRYIILKLVDTGMPICSDTWNAYNEYSLSLAEGAKLEK